MEKKKKSSVYIYRTLGKFIKEHFNGVSLSFDQEKKALIEELEESSSFASTHSIVAALNNYGYFSLDEARAILNAAQENNQVGKIITDYDISDFMLKAAVPHQSNLTTSEQRNIVEIIIKEQAEREA